jgi:hypothetical protein
VRIGAEELPNGEVGDQEELECAEKDGAADPRNAAAIREPGADEHAEQEAGVNDGHEVVQANEEIAGKESHKREEKCDAAIRKHRAGKISPWRRWGVKFHG